jgi:hypothetical protein
MAALFPAIAAAQTNPECIQQKHGNEVVGGLVGAGLGALLGNGLSGGHAGGTIIGGVGGAAVGATVAGGTTHCGENQYGYYDQNGQWVPRTVNANGYYGPQGQWIDGPPPGYGQGPPGDFAPNGPSPAYGQPGPGPNGASYGPRGNPGERNRYGYFDQNGRWVPNTATASGYYGPNGQWVSSSPQGYGQQTYGQQGYGAPAYSGPAYGQQPGAVYGSPSGRIGPRDTQGREAHIEARINERMADGSLSRSDGRREFRQLNEIRRMDADYRNGDGRLTPDQYRDIDHRLDDLSRELGVDGAPAPRPY